MRSAASVEFNKFDLYTTLFEFVLVKAERELYAVLERVGKRIQVVLADRGKVGCEREVVTTDFNILYGLTVSRKEISFSDNSTVWPSNGRRCGMIDAELSEERRDHVMQGRSIHAVGQFDHERGRLLIEGHREKAVGPFFCQDSWARLH